jgi:hypothetical protein
MPLYTIALHDVYRNNTQAEKSAAGIKQAAKPCVKRFAADSPLKNRTIRVTIHQCMQRSTPHKKKSAPKSAFPKLLLYCMINA